MKKELFLIRFIILIATTVWLGMQSMMGQCSVTINTFPYSEDFETSNGGWSDGGSFSDWTWGTPTKPVISNAANGAKCWVIGGLSATFYNYDERSYCESPCFDFTNIAVPYIQVNIFYETEQKYDGANLQYSLNQGTTWNNVGNYNDPDDCFNENWYNEQSVTNLSMLASTKHGWAGNVQPTIGSCQGGGGPGTWIVAKHTMPYLAGKSSVKFRFTFGAGSACNDFDGFAFDDVFIGETPFVFTFTPTIVTDVCSKGQGRVDVNVAGGAPPYTYAWSNGSTTNSTTPVAPGTYTITVIDNNNCTTSQTYTVPGTPPVVFTVQSGSDTCSNGQGIGIATVLSGSPPFNYIWSTSLLNNDTVNNLVGGMNMLYIKDSLGCMDSLSFVVNDINYISFNLDSFVYICPNEQLTLNIGIYDSILWNTGSTNSVININEPGTYTVTVTTGKGCSATDSISAIVNCADMVFVPNAFTPNDDVTNEWFVPLTTFALDYEFKVFNRFGTEIYSTNKINTGWDGTYNGAKCPSGLYGYSIVYSKTKDHQRIQRGTVRLIR